MAYQYNPLENNFTVYTPAERTPVEVKLPLMDEPLDISKWSVGVTDDGTPVVKDNGFTTENNPMQEIPQQVSQPISQNSSSNIKTALEFFISKGLTQNQAAGVVGNLMHESGDRTLTKIDNIGDKGTSFGMAQWHDTSKGVGRWTNLINFAKSKGTSEKDFKTQLEFVWHELESNPKWLTHLKATTTIDGATRSFMENFERPNPKYAALQKRIQNAKSIFQ